MDKNMFWNYKETRGQSGYKSAWLYKLPSETKYHLLCATEQVPYVFGDTDSFEIDILQSDTKGKIQGKASLEPVDVDVLHHRDNAYRFEKLKGITVDFMSINAEFVGYKFNGTIDYRPNTAEADVNRATVTITPMSGTTTPIFDARDLIQETLYFKNSIDDTVSIDPKTRKATVNFETQYSGTTLEIVKLYINENGEEVEDDKSVPTPSGTVVDFTAKGLYVVTAKDTSNTYASWTTTVYVEE